ADFLVLVGVLGFERFGEGVGGDGARSDPGGCGEVAIHEGRRDGEDFAEVVGGEALLGAEFDGEEIADDVGVLAAVEAAGGDASGVGFEVAVGLGELVVQVLDHGIHLGGARDAFGGHLAGADLTQDEVPAIAAGGEGRSLGEGGDIQSAGGEVVVVTGGAGSGEDGGDSVFKGGSAGGRQDGADGQK